MITIGDFYQLPPIKAKPIFGPFKNECFNFCHPWRAFEMIELNEILRQGDNCFTGLLNNVRVGNLRKEDSETLSERIVDKSNVNYPADAVHIWAKNALADNHDDKCLNKLMNRV